MKVYLIDGTYELFRHYYAVPKARDASGREVGAVRGVLNSVRGMITGGATHIGVATDHVIESFRNALWPGYKTSAGVERDRLAQFTLLEEVLAAYGFAVWPMVEFEADDALAAAAAAAERDARVEQVVICTPDKDLSQCVRGTRVVQMDRRKRTIRASSASSSAPRTRISRSACAVRAWCEPGRCLAAAPSASSASSASGASGASSASGQRGRGRRSSRIAVL